MIPADDTAHRALSSRESKRAAHRAPGSREQQESPEDTAFRAQTQTTDIEMIRHAIIIVAAVARPCAGFVVAPRSCAPLPRSLARQRAVVVADAADLSRSLAIIDAQ